MAYRRKQGIPRASTFKEESLFQPSRDEIDARKNLTTSRTFSPSSSLAAQAITTSASVVSDSTPSFRSDKVFAAYDGAHQRREEGAGFWGVLARKAKEIIEEENPPQPAVDPQPQPQPLTNEARKQSKGSQSPGDTTPWQPLMANETQMKTSRDVAMATAAKAKVLLRELKSVKADLAFSKLRCSQLEEENKVLRDSREKGGNPDDEDLIRVQLETLLAEKARLANENSAYARENRFLREIVEYHQLTRQDVLYIDEGTQEVKMLSLSPSSPISPSPEPNDVVSQVLDDDSTVASDGTDDHLQHDVVDG